MAPWSLKHVETDLARERTPHGAIQGSVFDREEIHAVQWAPEDYSTTHVLVRMILNRGDEVKLALLEAARDPKDFLGGSAGIEAADGAPVGSFEKMRRIAIAAVAAGVDYEDVVLEDDDDDDDNDDVDEMDLGRLQAVRERMQAFLRRTGLDAGEEGNEGGGAMDGGRGENGDVADLERGEREHVGGGVIVGTRGTAICHTKAMLFNDLLENKVLEKVAHWYKYHSCTVIFHTKNCQTKNL